MLQLALTVIGIAAPCVIIGGSLGLLIFRFATRDHPLRTTGDDDAHVVTRVNDHYYRCEKCGKAGSERWANLHQFPRPSDLKTTALTCDCGAEYEIRSDTPKWSAPWIVCGDCFLTDGGHAAAERTT